jgi:hypothetical protein
MFICLRPLPIITHCICVIFCVYCILIHTGRRGGGLTRKKVRVATVHNSNGKDIETKAERSFDLDLVFNIEAKRTCLFQNL